MRLIVLFNLLFFSILGQAESNFSGCLIDGYYATNPGPKTCDFKNMRVNFFGILGKCNIAVLQSQLQNATQKDFGILMVEISQAKQEAFKALNSDLNKRLQECGHKGSIQYTETGGTVEIY